MDRVYEEGKLTVGISNNFLHIQIPQLPSFLHRQTSEGTIIDLTSRRRLVSHPVISFTNLSGLLYNPTHAFR